MVVVHALRPVPKKIPECGITVLRTLRVRVIRVQFPALRHYILVWGKGACKLIFQLKENISHTRLKSTETYDSRTPFTAKLCQHAMKLLIKHPTDTAITLFRRSGYTFQREENGELSFIRSLARAGYPRFHCYVRSQPEGFECNLHLDQKRETYGRSTRHHGEYTDEGALADEIQRIERIIGTLSRIT